MAYRRPTQAEDPGCDDYLQSLVDDFFGHTSGGSHYSPFIPSHHYPRPPPLPVSPGSWVWRRSPERRGNDGLGGLGGLGDGYVLSGLYRGRGRGRPLYHHTYPLNRRGESDDDSRTSDEPATTTTGLGGGVRVGSRGRDGGSRSRSSSRSSSTISLVEEVRVRSEETSDSSPGGDTRRQRDGLRTRNTLENLVVNAIPERASRHCSQDDGCRRSSNRGSGGSGDGGGGSVAGSGPEEVGDLSDMMRYLMRNVLFQKHKSSAAGAGASAASAASARSSNNDDDVNRNNSKDKDSNDKKTTVTATTDSSKNESNKANNGSRSCSCSSCNSSNSTTNLTPTTEDDNINVSVDINADFFSPAVDIFDTPGAYILHVALPGVKRDDVAVSWDPERGALTVAGEVRRPGDEAFLQTLRVAERRVGAFTRKIALPLPLPRQKELELDGDGIAAKLDDGILVIVVPKLEKEKECMQVRKVDVL